MEYTISDIEETMQTITVTIYRTYLENLLGKRIVDVPLPEGDLNADSFHSTERPEK